MEKYDQLQQKVLSIFDKKNGKKIRNCRCGQTVVYVREIRTRYFNYIRLTETQQQLAIRPKFNWRKYQVN